MQFKKVGQRMDRKVYLSWAIFLLSFFIGACRNYAANNSSLPDQIQCDSTNLQLIIAINGIPAVFVSGNGSYSGYKSIAQFEKSGENQLEIMAVEVDALKKISASIRIHMHDSEQPQAAEIKIPTGPAIGEKRYSVTFMPIGKADWIYDGIGDIKELSPTDESDILSNVASVEAAFQHHDTEGIVSLGKIGREFAAKANGTTEVELEHIAKKTLNDGFRDLTKIEIQSVDRLRLVKFSRGIAVIAKDQQPIIRMSDPENLVNNTVAMRSLIFCKIASKWVCIN